MEKPAFGTALEEHLKRSNREIALPIEACVMMLLETGMKEEVRMDCGQSGAKLTGRSTRDSCKFVPIKLNSVGAGRRCGTWGALCRNDGTYGLETSVGELWSV